MTKPQFADLKPMPASRRSNHHPIIIGHRGAAALAPENTLPAFEAALRVGADGVEFDVQRTTDGHIIVFHDEDVARTTDGTGLMPEMSLAQMEALDLGMKFDARFAGTRVLQLSALFEWMQDNDLLLFLEMKEPFRFPGIEGEIAELIRAYNLVDRTQVRSFYHEQLHTLHQVAPDIAISELWLNYIPVRDEITYQTVNLTQSHCTEEAIRQLHEWGCTVTAWVVNDLERAQALKAWGIDGLTTDNPQLLQALFDDDKGG